MQSTDSLPGDQRAVLQLVLGRGRSYDQIARILSLDPSSVRERALTALDALGPQTRVTPERRAMISDYLLGQLPESDLDEVRDVLASSAAERAWARVVSSEVAPLASGPLPEIPLDTGGGRSDREEAVPAAPDPAGEHWGTPGQAGADEPAPRTGGSGPSSAASRVAAASAAGAASDEAAETAGGRRRMRRRRGGGSSGGSGGDGGPMGSGGGGPRSSRRGGMLVLALGIAVVAVVLIVLLSSGGSKKPGTAVASSSSSTPAASSTTSASTTTSSSSASAKVIAQINLTSPTKGSKTVGIAEILNEGSSDGVAIVAQDVPPNTKTPPNAYAVWLYNSPTDAHILGFVNPGVGSNGRLSTAGGLPTNASHYKQVIVTVESSAQPKTPGKIILQGTLTGL